MAKSFSEVLLELAIDDPRICGVSCDCWGFVALLAEKFPDRAIELGIAEQNLISVSAGLALRGKMPFAIGMNPFVTMRCFEQIRTDLGYGCKNVKVIGGYGSGLMYAGWGFTHHAMEEIGLMRLIPTMVVLMPSDAYETEQAMRAVAKMDCPAYIAVAGGTLPIDKPESERSFELGKASLLRDGNDVTIFGTGMTVADTLRAYDMLAEKNISARVYSMHTIKPIDSETILRSARETGLIITIEEHTVIGGLGGAVAEVLADAGAGTPLKRLGLQDVFACMVGSYQDIKNRFGITSEAIVDTVSQILK